MPFSVGKLPTDTNNAPSSSGYAPGTGVLPLQLGASTSDSSGQASAPLVTQSVITGPTGDPYQATVFAPGELRVSIEAGQLLYTGFDTGLDTVNMWKAPVAAGGGVAASSISSYTALGTGTSAGGYSYLESQPAFPPVNPGWLNITYGNNIPFPYIPNTYLFWGTGTSPSTPTAAVPLTDAAGFEILNSKMYAVMYQGGARQQIADLSSTGNGKQPMDANVHYYTMFYRGDRTYWCIDSLDNVVAYTTTGAPGPNINTLPLKLTAIAGPGAPTSSGVLTCNVVHVSDTTARSNQIADGANPWRKALVDPAGSLLTRTALTNAPIAAGVGTAAAIVKATPGYLSGALVTANASAALIIYDNASLASGTVIGYIPATATAGQYYPFNMPALVGITAGKVNGSPAITVGFS